MRLPDGMPRAALRFSGDYTLDWLAGMRGLLNADFNVAVTFASIARGNIRDPRADAELTGLPAGEGAPRLAISNKALARSLNLNPQTARRYVAKLIEGGWVIRTDEGLVIPPGLMSGPAARVASLRLMDRLEAMLTGIAELSGLALPAFTLDRRKAAMAMVITGDYVLRWTETYRDPARLSGWVMFFWAVLIGNVRHLNEDPVLRLRYAATPPPDELRRPVTVREIAQTLGTPYETTRTWMTTMTGTGGLKAVRGGYIVPRDLLQESGSLGIYEADLVNLRRMLTQLQEAGVVTPLAASEDPAAAVQVNVAR